MKLPKEDVELFYNYSGKLGGSDNVVSLEKWQIFWLADTWWMGLVKCLRWPEDFQLLTADRVKKGFTVI